MRRSTTTPEEAVDPYAHLPQDQWREAHGAPKRATLLALLGQHAAEADEFLLRLDRLEWLSHTGQPQSDSRFSMVSRVYTRSEARAAYESKFTDLYEYRSLYELHLVVCERSLFNMYHASKDLTRWYSNNEFPHALFNLIDSDIQHTVLEIVTQDYHDQTHFRDKWTWYEAGHLPCGYTEDGTPIIF